ncbi:hypothetical protein BpHYR1_031859 [Brachionus plicatilis]|uniref:Uncharacterized protein n=1 Tax=Brachionus plicatilis TaxID=10195 RepID=A0A3M7SGP5_BRAPC|nr:hypothetical protein BpHYR1_031859 [Brachionus plicatilis]
MPIMYIPLERKRRPGRPKATTNALTLQPNETQNVNYLGISVYEELDSDDPPVQEPISKKNRLERTPIVTTQPQVKKKTRTFFIIIEIKKIHLFLSSMDVCAGWDWTILKLMEHSG